MLGQSSKTDKIELPTPVIGWDSLNALITYPEIARRSYQQGGFIINLTIDTLGFIKKMKVYELSNHNNNIDSTYNITRPLYRYLKGTQWYPAVQSNRKIEFTVSIPIIFVFEGGHQVKPIIKSVPWFDRSQ